MQSLGNISHPKRQNIEAEEEVEFPMANEDDETNTVIENECENDYGNIYSSLG